MKLSAEFTPATLNAAVSTQGITAKLTDPVVKEYIQVEYYDGPYEFTPSEQEQTVEAKWLRMAENVTINPIPSNYGRITWSGAGTPLTVS